VEDLGMGMGFRQHMNTVETNTCFSLSLYIDDDLYDFPHYYFFLRFKALFILLEMEMEWMELLLWPFSYVT